MISSLKQTSRKGGKGMTTNTMHNIAEDQEALQEIDLDFLERMDFSKIEEKDPSWKNDYKDVFSLVIPCHIELDYNSSSQYMQTQEQLKFRVLA